MIERRLSVIYVMLCAVLLTMAARLLWLQVVWGTDEDPDAVLRTPIRLDEIPAARGAILDRNGAVLVRDDPTLDVMMAYPDILLLSRAAGLALLPAERKFLRPYVRPRVRAAGPSTDPAEMLLMTKALGDTELSAGEEESLCAYAARRLHDLALVTGSTEDHLFGEMRSVVGRVRALRQRNPRVQVYYEEKAAHALVSGVAVEAVSAIDTDMQRRFPGVTVRSGTRRVYPSGNVAPHVLGYLTTARAPERGEVPEDPSIRPGDRIGFTGIEKQYDALLRGSPGYENREYDPKNGRPVRHLLGEARPGRNVHLSLDLNAQKVAEAQLEGRVGAIAVMDLHTGEVLVLASAPMFDVRDVGASFRMPDYDTQRPLLSRAIQDGVPPGSMFKPMVAFAAGEIGPDRHVNCEGVIHLGRQPFHCTGTHSSIGMQMAIAYSCNVYFFETGRRIGPEQILRWAADFGFGEKTGVDLPYEMRCRLPKLEDARRWPTGNTLNISIGQGDLRATPLQVTVAMAAIANGGKILRPTLLRQVEPTPDGATLAGLANPVLRELSLPPQALKAVRDGLWDTTYYGTGHLLTGLRELGAAIKTGTAQTPLGVNINHCWVGGYLPHNAPRYAFAVVFHNIEGHGADIAGPPAEAVLRALLQPKPAE